MNSVKTPQCETCRTQCETCRKTYDLVGWRALAVLSAGTFGNTVHGNETATGATQTRRCECGASVMLTVYFQKPVPPSEAAAALALALLGE